MGAVAKLDLVLDAVTPFEAMASETTLTPPLVRVYQKRKTWCWAACLASALQRLDKPGVLKHIVSKKLRCGSVGCDDTNPPDECIKRLSSVEIRCLWRGEGFSQAALEQNALDATVIEQQLAGGPIQALVGGIHVVLIDGIRKGAHNSIQLRVMDPGREPHDSHGYRWMPADLDDLGSGDWKMTIVNLTFDGVIGQC